MTPYYELRGKLYKNDAEEDLSPVYFGEDEINIMGEFVARALCAYHIMGFTKLVIHQTIHESTVYMRMEWDLTQPDFPFKTPTKHCLKCNELRNDCLCTDFLQAIFTAHSIN